MAGMPHPPVAPPLRWPPPIPLLLPPPPVGSLSPAREMGACRRAVFVDRLWGVPFPPCFLLAGTQFVSHITAGEAAIRPCGQGEQDRFGEHPASLYRQLSQVQVSLRGGEGRAPGRWGLGTQSWGACPGADTGAQRGGHGGRGWQPMRPQSPPVKGAHLPCRPHSELLPLVPTATLALWACPSAPLSSSVQPSQGARVARGPGPGGRGA